jgi:Right handed beta helix region
MTRALASMNRVLALSLALGLAAAGCGGTRTCKENTLLLRLTFAGSAANADMLQLSAIVGTSTLSATAPHTAGSTSGTLEVTFSGTYPAGQSLQLTVTALAGGSIVGRGTATRTLDVVCSAIDVNVAVTGPGMDFAVPDDLSGADFAGADFAVPPDFAILPDLAGPHDFAVPPDLTAVPPDLAAPRDLAPPPDLAGCITGGNFCGVAGNCCAGLICQANTCVQCGGPNQPCCPGGMCSGTSLFCEATSNSCQPCGDFNQQCCPAPATACNSAFVCDTTMAVPSCVCPKPPANQPHFVDALQGRDDDAHGGGPGVCAFKSISFSLTRFTGVLQVAPGVYDPSNEGAAGFPIRLTGQQQLSCNSGATITSRPSGATPILQLSGTANAITGCKIEYLPAMGNNLIEITNSATATTPHKITSCEISQGTTGVTITTGDFLNLTNNFFHDFTTSAIFWPPGRHGIMTGNTFQDPAPGLDIMCNGSNNNITGSGNVLTSAAACVNCVNCPFP